MGNRYNQGFTIIEVVLFLAITGLLMAGILGNISGSLNTQRYRDGVELTRDKIAAQYNKVYSLTNDYEVDSLGEPKLQNDDPCVPGGKIYRGTSECLYVGRLIDIRSYDNARSSEMSMMPVIAEPSEAIKDYRNSQRFGDQTTDGSSAYTGNMLVDYTFKQYPGVNDWLIEKDELAWGLAAVRLNTPKNTQASDVQSITILVLRSPVDGTVTTYNLRTRGDYDVTTPTLNSFMQPDNLQEVSFCLADRSGVIDPPQRAKVIVHKSAASQSDIETVFEGSEC